MIARLAGTAPEPKVTVDRQTAADIVDNILQKHRECCSDYDRICSYFDDKDLERLCCNLWQFCKRNFHYVVESTKAQYTSCPYTILTGGRVDCKNYSLFCAGILDALRRDGYPLSWKFRFVSFSASDPAPEHVFVVVSPSRDDIWIDPVLDVFDHKIFYFHHKDYTVRTSEAAVGSIEGRIGTTQAEQKILAELLEYQQGLIGAMAQAKSTGSFNTIVQSVYSTMQAAALTLIPGGTQAEALIKEGVVALDNKFGVGSTAARLLTDWTTFNFQGIWNDLFGRTYNTDQYWGAVFYKFYVLGQNITNEDQVADSDVLPALKWFIDRTGVFISGREHIIALTQGSAAYLDLYNVNSDTTTDPDLVAAAVAVAQKYWMVPSNPDSFPAANMGGWAGTIGTFDQGIVQIANSYGLTPEQYVAETDTADQVAQQTATQTGGTWIPGVPNWSIAAAAALFIIAIIAD